MCDGVFFFKQKTAYEIRNCDWSSDVCSSDLGKQIKGFLRIRKSQGTYKNIINLIQTTPDHRIPNLKHVTAQKSFYFLNKNECPRCSHIFYRKSCLKTHLLKCSSSTKERFIPQKQLSKSFNFNTDIPRFFLNQKLEKRDFFFKHP